MQELWSSASYEPHLLSLPFAFAPAAMLVVITYALFMRGEPILRAWMLLHFLALMPYSIMMTLSPSFVSAEAAEGMFRIAAAFIPMAAAGGAGFQFRLLGKHREARWFVWSGVAISVTWIIVGATTDAAVTGVRWLPAGLWYANAGPYAWLALLSTIIVATPGFIALGLAAIKNKPSVERRQLRLVLAANLVTYAGLTDVGLAYDIGVFPLGWLLSGAGSVLVARALVAEDLLRVRAVDTLAPRIVLHLAGAILLGWVALGLAGYDAPWWAATIVIAVSFCSVRVTIAVIGLITRGARSTDNTLDRLLAQLVARARPLEREPEIASLAIDVIELGIGQRVDVLLAAAEDYGWMTQTGEKLADENAPDPLLGAWLVDPVRVPSGNAARSGRAGSFEQRRIIFANDPSTPEDLAEPLTALFERNKARALVPVANSDELLAVVFLPAQTRRLRSRELAFFVRAAERLGEAIIHARMAQRAAERAMIARQVELAATLQQQLLPKSGPHAHNGVTVVGSWVPATRCAGDFWTVYPLGTRGVLVAIGDVTGHGVASATVTAAATSAVEVVVRRSGEALDLTELVTAIDAAVRRVGGGQLQMTCFAAILAPAQQEVRFVSCGHTTPYLCRVREGADIELQALVGRGNPLGGGGSPPKVQQKPLRAGDLVVWYTDGVIEAQDPAGEAFGDRRLQRMLRRLDKAKFEPAACHDVIHASIAAHRSGKPRNDDETLVVAQYKEAAP